MQIYRNVPKHRDGAAILDIIARSHPFIDEGDRPPMRFRELSVQEYMSLVGPFVLVGLTGVVVRLFYPQAWPWVDVAHVLADALIVAGIVGSLIELYSVKFLIHRVAGDLAERLVGRGLPSELQGQIRQIVDTTLVRGNFVKSYRFSDPQDGYVTIDMKITFDVKNYSDSVQEYAPGVGEESFYEPEFISVDFGVPNGKSLSYTGQKLAQFIKTDPDIKAKSINGLETIKLDSIRRNPDAVCKLLSAIE